MSDSPENLESASEGRSHNYSDSAEFEIKDKNKKLLDAAGEERETVRKFRDLSGMGRTLGLWMTGECDQIVKYTIL